ncbi:MAG: hypothetical protein HYZ81_20610 [Nitrospinae bacterium]|nr:hypothetical protein [Nitrospinota bacterium]
MAAPASASEGKCTPLVGHVFTGFLREEEPPDFSLFLAILQQMNLWLDGPRAYRSPWDTFFSKNGGTFAHDGFLWSDDKQLLFVLANPRAEAGEFNRFNQAVQHIRADVANLRRAYPEVEAGITGRGVLESDEMTAAQRDTTIATVISVIGVTLLLGLSLLALGRVGSDFNLLHLQAKGVESVVWLEKIAESTKRSVLFGEVVEQFDLGDAGGRKFLNMAAGGILGEIHRLFWEKREGPDSLARCLGGAFKVLRRKRFPQVTVWCDGLLLTRTASIVVIGNIRTYSAGVSFTPLASPADGFFDVCTFPKPVRLDLLTWLVQIFRERHLFCHGIRYQWGREIHMAGEEIACHVDGEYVGQAPLTVSIIPRKVPIVVPISSTAVQGLCGQGLATSTRRSMPWVGRMPTLTEGSVSMEHMSSD